jgi:hypothetical protein
VDVAALGLGNANVAIPPPISRGSTHRHR